MEDGVVQGPAREGCCASCGRFIGPADGCPYCGADSVKRPGIRILRHASLVLAVLGLAFLYLSARCRDIPLVRIGDITPFMNYATVRIAGTVPRPPAAIHGGGATGSIFFAVDDGSGRMRVSAGAQVARALIEQSRLPTNGAWVDIVGRLSIAADGPPWLRLQSAEQLVIGGRKSVNAANAGIPEKETRE